jgi:DNA polymerase-2
LKGFLLQPTYRIRSGRPFVHLHGVLEDGRSFLIRDGRDTPSFYIRADDAERAAKLGAERIEATRLTTIDGHSASEILLRLPSDTPPLRDRLRTHGIRCYEADVRFAVRYLIRRGLRGAVEILCDASDETIPGIDLVFDEPVLRPLPREQDFQPRLKVLSMDIETDMRGRSLFSVAFFGRWQSTEVSEVLLWCPDGLECPDSEDATHVEGFETQAGLLRATADRIREIDPDVLTGWNVVDFDLRVLANLAETHGVRLDIGRGSGGLRLRKTRTPWNTWDASIPGRVVLDGIHLLRSSFVKMDSYGLGAVAQEVLGESKLISGSHRGEAIEEAFRHDRRLLVDYNLFDAKLVVDILDELRLVDLAVERSKLTGLPIDRVGGSIAAFDFLYLEKLWPRGQVAFSVEGDGDGSANLGGHVLDPETGLWRNVLVFDFKSLYPSIIRTFQIDPLGFLPDAAARDAETDVVVAPNGAAFRRRPGILPGLLDELFPRREAAKRAGDEVASHAIKILMNSFYGVLGTRACRFAHPALAGSITAWGRELLLWSKAEFERRGFRVLYGDTDSLFVLSGDEDPKAAQAIGQELLPALNAAVADYIAQRWQVESKLELEFEKLYRQLLLPPMRGGGGGARKRYAGLVGEGAEAHVVFTGMEVVRRDWTDLAKTVQRQLYDELFLSESPEEGVRRYLKRMVREVRAGEHNDELIYRKALRKPLGEYTATTPPHVAAAKKLRGRPGRMISYVVTVAGPEPAKEQQNAYHHEHYVQKQIRPVAEPVLGVLGLEFDEVIGDAVQLSLFS